MRLALFCILYYYFQLIQWKDQNQEWVGLVLVLSFSLSLYLFIFLCLFKARYFHKTSGIVTFSEHYWNRSKQMHFVWAFLQPWINSHIGACGYLQQQDIDLNINHRSHICFNENSNSLTCFYLFLYNNRGAGLTTQKWEMKIPVST